MRPLLTHHNPEELIVPPVNFSLVAKGVYRGSYPNFTNFSFLKSLGLKTVLFLCPESYPQRNAEFLSKNGINRVDVPMEGNKEPFKTIADAHMVDALRFITDARNHPIYIHCNKGTHRTGTVVGCLRKLQDWCLTSIFEEYRCFAGAKARQIDEQYIELFELPRAALDRSHFPSWLRRRD